MEKNTLTISGFERECKCAHCGRPLKLGVRVAESGELIGADCFVKQIRRDSKRYSGNGKPSASMVLEYAVIASKGLDYAARMYGYGAASFCFQKA